MAVDVAGVDPRVRAFELIQELQGGQPGAADELAELTAAAKEAGLAHVARIGMYGFAVHAWFNQSATLAAEVDALIAEAARGTDRVVLALGLALRAAFANGDEPASPHHDRDLAEAVVILDQADAHVDGALELISARTACGIAFDMRSLWELGDEQYAAAIELAGLAGAGVGDTLLSAVMFNRVEAHVTWAARLRQLGEEQALAERWASFARVEAQSRRFPMPAAWRRELEALALLMAAVAGQDVATAVAAAIAGVQAQYSGGELAPDQCRAIGLLVLAGALSEWNAGRPAEAGSDAALAAVDAEAFPLLYDLALHLAAEVEAAGGRGYGIQAARRQMSRQWADRLRALEAMRSNIAAQRMRAEIDRLSSENRRDELTGIGNRRALEHYVRDLDRRRVEQVAVVMADVDAFKGVNDGHGHAVGDSVLARIASVLDGGIRPGDLAVRLGGDEFLVVLAGADRITALERAEQLLAQIAGHPWGEVGAGLRVAVSMGVAAGAADEFDDVRRRADAAVYQSKRAGGGVVS